MKARSEMPELGKNIAFIRKGKNISLEELSQRSGVSKGMLSQIEQGKVNPTVAVVWKIAYGLDTPFQELFSREEGERLFNPIHANETVLLECDQGRCVFRILSPLYLAEKLEMYTLSMKKDGLLQSEAHLENTEEFVTVLSGKVAFEAGGKQSVLEKGDSIHYRADTVHVIRNLANSESLLYMVVKYPHWQG